MSAFVFAVVIAYMAALRAQPWATPQSVWILWVVPALSRQSVVVGRVYQVCAVGASEGQFAAIALTMCCRGSDVKAFAMSR